VGTGSTGIYSSDGINWSSYTGVLTTVNDICWNGTKFVAVGSRFGYTTKAQYSADGITWTGVLNDEHNTSLYSVCWGNGTFITGGSSPYIAYSSDGITWITDALPAQYVSGILQIIYNGTNFFILAYKYENSIYTPVVLYSPAPGGTWTPIGLNTVLGDIYPLSICWDGNRLIVYGRGSENGTNVARGAQSTTGIVWEQIYNENYDLGLTYNTPRTLMCNNNPTLIPSTNSIENVNSVTVVPNISDQIFGTTSDPGVCITNNQPGSILQILGTNSGWFTIIKSDTWISE
jgi:hypothetical protein